VDGREASRGKVREQPEPVNQVGVVHVAAAQRLARCVGGDDATHDEAARAAPVDDPLELALEVELGTAASEGFTPSSYRPPAARLDSMIRSGPGKLTVNCGCSRRLEYVAWLGVQTKQ
jgi:hypothetical protein